MIEQKYGDLIQTITTNISWGENVIKELTPKKLSALAKLYAVVFADPPWNEAGRCCACDTFYGRNVPLGSPCKTPGCESIVTEAYPQQETEDYILKELSKEGAVLTVLDDMKGPKQEPIGFAWGYNLDPERFIQEKYSDGEVRQDLQKLFEMVGISTKFFYFSECGVRGDYRGNGLSNLLSIKLLSSTNLPILMRTNFESPMMAVAERLGMTQIMGPEVAIDRTKGIIIPTSKVVNSLDRRRPERVLFFKP